MDDGFKNSKWWGMVPRESSRKSGLLMRLPVIPQSGPPIDLSNSELSRNNRGSHGGANSSSSPQLNQALKFKVSARQSEGQRARNARPSLRPFPRETSHALRESSVPIAPSSCAASA